MQIEVYGQPQGKQRARVCVRGNFARAYTPEKTASYESLINLSYIQALKGAPSPFWDKPVKINIRAIYQIPKSFSKKRTAEALGGQIRPQVKPDIDNVVKVVCDALNKVAYKDDTQVIKITASKWYGVEPKLIIDIDEAQTSRNDTL